MKKVIIFLAIIVLLFAGVGILTKMQNEEKVSGNNPYGKSKLHPETVKQLDDPNYSNIVLPADLNDELSDDGDATVYFFSPTCPHCKKTTPVVSPLSEDMGVDLLQYNLLEFEEGWDDYGITQTPTIVQYKDGKEVARITGYQNKAVFEDWFNEHSK
ncbi:thiol-disulfide isomerase/thioredoxin [Cytobacillus horneckiae]|uniref:Thioredoxin n=1 Tax=Cytobacillus horneckiae TaxID=549687 RepID=A0A2N0ZHK7_9BACI|nr:thioredoxin family protein [Cytobacillus horneckiae]NRG46018.1 thioredoxin family protein [Bacillus sp. CRN 9]MBN6887706.1 thioredoxin family protein [Cytobacillus horneckiae]MCM3178763.1 thioredoxin family protein [Cytobacillus horneckiae]MEC1158239.1 thioredoxin family protein [Cytobacillus horneckiae]MED2940117.1 thioredoxin family protein [Cytobacillus horneckiae]